MNQVKYCPVCKTEKPTSEFHRNKNSKDGLAYRCKTCCILKNTGHRTIVNLEGEVWKDIENFEGVYQISNKGRLKHIYVKDKCEKLVRLYKEKTGYYRITLSHKNIRKKISIHRIVAKLFIPNPDNLETVNHKDFDRTNNNADNLEWMTARDNVLHSVGNGRHFKKPVIQMDLQGNVIKEWASAYEVEQQIGFKSTTISRCCLGKNKTYMKCLWKFK